MKVVLVNTYDLGHQPFGLASPAAWLRERGHDVTCVDLSLAPLPSLTVRETDAVAFFLPMHTATRMAADAVEHVRRLNPSARMIAYGLYAAPNADWLRKIGFSVVVSGEFEQGVVDAVEGRSSLPVLMDRLPFRVPDRSAMPALARYAKVHLGAATKIVGYTEASRGCKHLCRHCPVVPVYEGKFRIVPREVVMADVRQQIAAGAQHITFGDPDFFNGPGHAVPLVEQVQTEFPEVTYDVTIKVEHLLKHANLLSRLRATGCLFITTAVESVNDDLLRRLDKGHTRADFYAAVALSREQGLLLAPTFVAFTPWTGREDYSDLLQVLRDLDLVDQVSPVQLALRLLVPPGSLLTADIAPFATGFDEAALLHRWRHPDAWMESFSHRALGIVSQMQKQRKTRREIFAALWAEVNGRPIENYDLVPRAAIPYMDEPWYC